MVALSSNEHFYYVTSKYVIYTRPRILDKKNNLFHLDSRLSPPPVNILKFIHSENNYTKLFLCASIYVTTVKIYTWVSGCVEVSDLHEVSFRKSKSSAWYIRC